MSPRRSRRDGPPLGVAPPGVTAKGALLAVRPVLILRAFLSLVLLASGIGKLISPPDPTVLLPPLLGSLASVGGFLVVLVSALEIGAAVLLWASRRVRTVASMTVSALAILFLSVSATNAGRDEYLRDCGCFGRGSSLATGLKPEVALLALVAQAAVLGWAAHLLRGSDPAPARRGESWRVTRIWLLLLAGAAAIGLFTRAGHLRSLMAEERVLQSQAGELGLAAAFPGTTFLGDESYWRRPFSQEPCSLVVFSATCGACLEQATWWRDLVQAWEAEGQAIRFVGTSSAAQIQALVAQTGIPTDAVAVGDKKLLIYYGIDSVPTALRFNRDGLLVWRSDHAVLPPSGRATW